MKNVELPAPRTLNPKPNSILFHDTPQTCERQPLIAKRLPMPRRDHVDGAWRMRQDFIGQLHWLRFVYRRKARQSFSPEMLAFERLYWRDFSPTGVYLE